MTTLTLFIGDKQLSSWSLRPWLLLKQAEIPFTEKMIRLDRPETRAEILKVSPSGRVPCLQDGAIAVWDSLAICEYLAETFPERSLWPDDRRARAKARAVSAEMHSGFQTLRSTWPMQFATEALRRPREPVQADIDRIADIWESCRREFGRGGPFLFGGFSIADAMFAPVVSRFQTYGPVPLPPRAEEWRAAMWSLPAMREWGDAARAETAA
jgi:glutathione S-transferase